MSKYKQYIGLSSQDILAVSSVEGDSYPSRDIEAEDIITLINSPIIKSKFRIFVLYPGETINYEIPNADIGSGGSYSENYQDGQRRSLSFSLLNDTGKYTPNINSLWAGTRIRLEQGIVTEDGSTIWFWKGVFVINNISPSVSLNIPMVQISASDKFGLFENKTGTLDSTYTIPTGSVIEDVIKDILLYSNGGGDPFDSQDLLYHSVFKGKTTQVEISKNEGDTFGSILKELATQLSAEIFYNSMGQLTLVPLDEVSNDSDKPLIYEFQSNEGDFSELNFAYNLDEIINRIIVIGKSENGATYRAIAVNDNPESPFCYQRIGYRTGATINDSNITTQYLAEERAEYELRKQLMLKTTSSLTVAINPLLTVNNLISLTNEFFNFSHEKFLIQGLSFNLDYSGTCSLSISNLNNLFTKELSTGYAEINFDEEFAPRKLRAPTLFYNDKKQEIYWKDDPYALNYEFYINGSKWLGGDRDEAMEEFFSRYENGMNTLKIIPFLFSYYWEDATFENMSFDYIHGFISIIAKGVDEEQPENSSIYEDSSPSNSILITKWLAQIPNNLTGDDVPLFIGAKRIMKRKMARRRGGNLWNWKSSVATYQDLPTVENESSPEQGEARMVINEQMGYVYLRDEWQVCLTRHQVPRRYCLKDPTSIPIKEDEDNPIPDDIKINYFSGVVYYIQNKKKYVKLIPVLSTPDENGNTTILKYKWEKYILPSSKEPFHVNRNFSYSLGVPHNHTYIDLKSPKVKKTGKTITAAGETVKRQDIIAERQVNEKGYVPHNSTSTRSFDTNNFYPLRFHLTHSLKKALSKKTALYHHDGYNIVDITPLILNAVLYDNYKNFSMNKKIYRQSYNRNKTENEQNFWYRDIELYLHNPKGWKDAPEEEKYIKMFQPSIHIRVLSSYPKTEAILEKIHPEQGYVVTCCDPLKANQHWTQIPLGEGGLLGPEETDIGDLYEWRWEKEINEDETFIKSFYSKETQNPRIFYKKEIMMDNLTKERRRSKSLKDIYYDYGGEFWDFAPEDYYRDCAISDLTGWSRLYQAKSGLVSVTSSQNRESKNIFTVDSSAIRCGVGIPFFVDLDPYSSIIPSSSERTYKVEFKITSELDLPVTVDCLFYDDTGERLFTYSEVSESFFPSDKERRVMTINIPWDPTNYHERAQWCLLVFSPGTPSPSAMPAGGGILGTLGAGSYNPWFPSPTSDPTSDPTTGGGVVQSRKFKVTLYSIFQSATEERRIGKQDHDIRWSQIIDVK